MDANARNAGNAAAKYLQELAQKHGIEASAEAVAELFAQAPTVDLPAGEVVFREGDSGEHALFVVAGRLRATLQGRPIGDTFPGDVVGEAAIFVSAGSRSATVTAVEPTTCLKLGRDLFRTSSSNAAVIALEAHLCRLLCKRIAATDALLVRAWREAASIQGDVRERILLLGGSW
jgi:CRP-like cAMP-binding protein